MSARRWLVVAAPAAVSVVVGAWVIGLSPAYAAGLVVALLAGSALLVMKGQRHTSPQSTEPPSMAWLGVAGRVVVAGVTLAVLIQGLPIGRAHANPAVAGEPQWSSPRTRELMVNACYGCHSSEVEWPWYSNVAPVSWAISDHVDEGRDELNYSEFVINPGEAEETIEVIREGSMPPAYYTRFGLHPEARLSSAEIDELIAGLAATPGFSDDDGEESDDGDEDEDEDEDGS